MDISGLLTVIIPTYNRPVYLKRILKYFKSYENMPSIQIADSSKEELIDPSLKKLIHGNSKITYKRYPESITFAEKCRDACNEVKTKYSVFCADDDFLNVTSLIECVDFLELNDDYGLAHGLYSSFTIRKNNNGTNSLFWEPCEIMKSIEHDIPSQRLEYHLSNYTGATFYAVHRSGLMQIIWDETVKNTKDVRFGEILPSSLSLINSKMMILESFYCLREEISDSSGRSADKWYQLVQKADYARRLEKVKKCLTKHLSEIEKIGILEAAETVDRALAGYLKFTRIYKEKSAPIFIQKKLAGLKRLFTGYFKKLDIPARMVKAKYVRIFIDKDAEYNQDFEKMKKLILEKGTDA